MSEGEDRKNAGQEQVLAKERWEWKEGYRDIVKDIALRRKYFSPDAVHHVVMREIGPPHHHNVFPAMAHACLREKIMEKTGERIKSVRPIANAHEIPVYRSLMYLGDDERTLADILNKKCPHCGGSLIDE